MLFFVHLNLIIGSKSNFLWVFMDAILYGQRDIQLIIKNLNIMKSQIHELRNLITNKMSKNLKTVALIAIVILAVSCKKEKNAETICRVTSIKSNSDSTIINYNASNQVIQIKNITPSDTINMAFANDGIYHKQTITGSPSIPVFTINYILNSNGNIDRFDETITNASSVYVNSFNARYDTDGHLIWYENIVTKSGFHFESIKDSFVYENGNMTKFYQFRSPLGSGNLRNFSLYATTLINYTNLKNTASLYVNKMYAPDNIIGTSLYYLINFPYIFHLLGKGSKDLPLNSTTTFNSPGGDIYSLDYSYNLDENNLVKTQTINRTPAAINYPKTYTFSYACK